MSRSATTISMVCFNIRVSMPRLSRFFGGQSRSAKNALGVDHPRRCHSGTITLPGCFMIRANMLRLSRSIDGR